MIRVLLLLAMSFAARADAQTADPAPYHAAFDSCLAQPDADHAACIGDVSATCMEAEEGGYSTYGMVSCVMMENGLWDEVLNADWPRHRALAKRQDAAEMPEFRQADEKLLAAQRAWIAFRDADCAAAAARWGSGSMRQTAYAGCLLNHTAQRVLDLRAQWETF